jgi:hypothetical protein
MVNNLEILKLKEFLHRGRILICSSRLDMFDYRHHITREDLRFHAAVKKIRGNDTPMTIAITGSSGFIGSS